MRIFKALRLCFMLGMCLLSAPPVRAAETFPPKFIFLFIGDGMGFEQCRMANLALRERDASEMRMTRLPVTGQIHTSSANKAVTDSAAAGTALACGVKTNNGMIGQRPDGTVLETISRKLLREGMKTGILSSVFTNHATPAAFYSQVAKRNLYEDIAMQFIGSGVHFLAGRGLSADGPLREKIHAAYREQGIEVVLDFAQAGEVPHDQRMALLAPSVGNPRPERGDLADVTALAIERMQDHPGGFFLMIEGGAIDWAGHGNQGWPILEETLAMDRALEVAHDFYLLNPENTLIVVTADHETGGLAVQEDTLDLPGLRRIEEERSRFEAALPGEGEEITHAVLLEALEAHFGITEHTEAQRMQLEEAIRGGNRKTVLRLAVNTAQSAKGITWSTGNHTGVDVPVFAVGAGAELFRGTYDNTRIPAKIFAAATGRPLLAE